MHKDAGARRLHRMPDAADRTFLYKTLRFCVSRVMRARLVQLHGDTV
jgi:hypothetical protein